MSDQQPESEKCACGQPLHYRSPVSREFTERAIKREGVTVEITTPAGTWRVPRHFVALHGIKARELPEVAARYGFEKVE